MAIATVTVNMANKTAAITAKRFLGKLFGHVGHEYFAFIITPNLVIIIKRICTWAAYILLQCQMSRLSCANTPITS